MYFIDKSGFTATAFFPNGNRVDFNIKGDGSFEGPEGKDYGLEADGNGYLMTDKTLTKYFFDEDGYLTAIEDINGRRTEIDRDGAEINYISNSSGTLFFDYATYAPADLMGDVDEDGVLTIDDVIMVMQYAAGVISLTPRQFYLGDVNGDGVVDLADAALILRLISEENPSPSAQDEMPIDTDEMPLNTDEMSLDTKEMPFDTEEMTFDPEEMPIDTDNMPMDTDCISMDSNEEQQIIDCISGFAARKGLTTADIRSNTSNLEDALQMLVSTVNDERYDRITTINSNDERVFREIGKISQITDQTGRSVSYTYEDGYLLSFTNSEADPAENTINYTYEDHRISEISDFNGNTYLINTYDELGRIIYQELAGQGTTEFSYDFVERVSTITTPDNATHTYRYDDRQNITSVTDNYGTTEYTYEDGRITSITDKLDNTTFYNYSQPLIVGDVDGDGRVTTDDVLMIFQYIAGNITLTPRQLFVADVDGNGIVDYVDISLLLMYLVEASPAPGGKGNIIDEEDAQLIAGLITEFAAGKNIDISISKNSIATLEDLQSVLCTVTGRNPSWISFSYHKGNIYSIEYPDETEELFIYNMQNRVIRAMAKDNTIRYYDYDEQGNLLSFTDANGNTSSYTYDSNNNMLTSEDGEGNISEYEYNSEGNMTKSTDPLGNETFYDYDNQGRLIQQTNDDGSTVDYEYSPAGKLLKITDDDNNDQTYEVNGNGYYTVTTDPMNYSTITEYNEMNKPISVTDAEGNETEYDYDSVGQLSLTRDALGGEISYGYDLAGRMTSMTDARNNTWIYEYDAEGRLTSTTDPLNNVSSSEYDNMGRTVTTTNARNVPTYYEYDDMGRTTKIIYSYYPSYPLGDVDGNGELTPEDAILILQYYVGFVQLTPWQLFLADVNKDGVVDSTDAALILRLVVEGSPSGSVSRGDVVDLEVIRSILELIVNDDTARINEISSITNNRNSTTSLVEIQTLLNLAAGLEYPTDAYGVIIRNVYDANGNLIEQYDKNHNKWSYSYDANNRMIASIDPLEYVTTYEYNGNGQQTRTVSPEGAVTISEYDEMGRLSSSTDPEGNETTYEYDNLGQLIQVNYADGTPIVSRTSNEYYPNGWLKTTTAQDYGITSYQYNKNGQVRYITDANSGVTEYEYDELGRTISLTDAGNGKTEYEYDANGNLRYLTDAEGGITEYRYDELNRVILTIDPLNNESEVEYDEKDDVSYYTYMDLSANYFYE